LRQLALEVHLVQTSDGRRPLFVTEHKGHIHILDPKRNAFRGFNAPTSRW
jgi:hypothetical protein